MIDENRGHRTPASVRRENQLRAQGRSSLLAAALLGGALLAGACSRAEKAEVPPTAQGIAAPRAAASDAPAALAARPTNDAAATSAESQEFRYPAPERLVAFGDVHGDLAALKSALRLAGAIDTNDQWIGGKLVVVQTGDQLDRGDDDKEILDYLERLTARADAFGGALRILNGNHEIMNVAGDFRYITERAFETFGAFAKGPLREPLTLRFPDGMRGRAAAFLPGGHYARLLAKRKSAIVVGDSAFVHGGLREEHVKYGIGRMNHELSQWMLGKSKIAPNAVTSHESPLWIRDFGEANLTAETCQALDRSLAALGVKRLVIGHTIQETGLNSACDGKVWRLDVAMSSFYGRRPPQAIEIQGEVVRVLGVPSAAAPPIPASGPLNAAKKPDPSMKASLPPSRTRAR